MYNYLRGRLKQLDIDQAGLAIRMGLKQPAISKRLTGRTPWTVDVQAHPLGAWPSSECRRLGGRVLQEGLILMAVANMKNCRGCIYRGYAGSIPICQYILFTHRCRPCPAGDGCTVKTTTKGEFDMKKAWDETRARQLYEEGKSDLDIKPLREKRTRSTAPSGLSTDG